MAKHSVNTTLYTVKYNTRNIWYPELTHILCIHFSSH